MPEPILKRKLKSGGKGNLDGDRRLGNGMAATPTMTPSDADYQK